MAHKGRKRSLKKRQPNGQVRDRRPAREDLVAKAKRAREKALRGAEDPTWGTELGRLLLLHRITPTAFAAGREYHRLVGDYRKSIEAPKCIPKVGRYGAVGGSAPIPFNRVEISQIKAQYDTAREWLLRVVPAGEALSAVHTLVIEDKHLLPEQLRVATLGLDTLATHWGLTKNRNAP